MQAEVNAKNFNDGESMAKVVHNSRLAYEEPNKSNFLFFHLSVHNIVALLLTMFKHLILHIL